MEQQDGGQGTEGLGSGEKRGRRLSEEEVGATGKGEPRRLAFWICLVSLVLVNSSIGGDPGSDAHNRLQSANSHIFRCATGNESDILSLQRDIRRLCLHDFLDIYRNFGGAIFALANNLGTLQGSG